MIPRCTWTPLMRSFPDMSDDMMGFERYCFAKCEGVGRERR